MLLVKCLLLLLRCLAELCAAQGSTDFWRLSSITTQHLQTSRTCSTLSQGAWMEKVSSILEQEDWTRLLFLPAKKLRGARLGSGGTNVIDRHSPRV